MKAKVLASLFFLCSLGILSPALAQTSTPPAFLNTHRAWVDSVFATLTPDERIAQLIMVAATSDTKRSLIDTTKSRPAFVEKLIRENKVGGVVFFQGGPVPQARLTNYYQSISKVPLLVAMDAEWGLAMRIDSTVRYPYQMTLGAIQGHDELLYDMGTQLAAQARRLGVHVNFAPVADVNNNPNNPVINFRSFGENKYQVAQKALAYMKGMQDHGLLTSAKHFPGHGDTGVDSHYDLPLIKKSTTQLDTLELYPFKVLINNGLSGMMIAHLSIPALDATPNLPSTLSKPIVTDLLRHQLGFSGLIYSDAMNMKGVTKYFSDGKADALGLEAGMDLLEFTEDVPKAIAEIKKSLAAGRITQAEIDFRCRKVLEAKAWVGLAQYRPVVMENLVEDLNPKQAELTNRLLTEKALTVLKNDQDLLPLRALDTLRIAAVSLGAEGTTTFQQTLGLYTAVDTYSLSSKATNAQVQELLAKLGDYNLLLVGVHLGSISPRLNFGLTDPMNAALQQLMATNKAVVALFGNPYVLNKIRQPEQARALLMAYQLTPYTEDLSAQLIFGAIPAEGKLPVTVNERFAYGAGLSTPALGRLKYTIPEEVGLDSRIITAKIDSIANLAIRQKATPGCVVELARAGKVFFRKAYGTHTYESTKPTQLGDLYDLASVTKVTASTLALMSLWGQGKFDLDATMKDYLPGYQRSNKADLTWRRVLTHSARLKSWIQFWRDAQNPDGTWKKNTFSTEQSDKYPTSVVGDSLFIHKNYDKQIFKSIRDSPLNPQEGYVYSDLSFILYPQIVESLAEEPFEDYLKNHFYKKLGATSLTYNPLRFYGLDQIVPSERDTFFRKTVIHGQVHDEGAAMLGGLSGHAGLFGNANDLMKVMQMYLQNGYFGGQQLLTSNALLEFTRYQYPEQGSRRGLGFDKPTFKYTGNAPRYASPMSFGHTGFTGIMVWMDPSFELSYVFLSNRVYPTRDNNKLSQLNIRTAIMDVVYEQLLNQIH
ncbi:glycoside hydrolase family 3 N-terminal domain-containing protein [Rhabdobacter roseus]|uniref:beta-N-acetylhexosaminidase n=1 Tax=Rhabdobacter roseus TaxID=1655419 RepID=A0A840TP93_9BACT|nr:glycoside hydrolase family 3 N-terminal domain-containing protein [Rhabdobacter roseus]MBB5286126.1 beta-glucosidase-like glycosyl hydrolase/CubicO group peptidase (beta-lactamase class C family) [Rhabdobacter roseus]